MLDCGARRAQRTAQRLRVRRRIDQPHGQRHFVHRVVAEEQPQRDGRPLRMLLQPGGFLGKRGSVSGLGGLGGGIDRRQRLL